ncbi:phosphatase PAP2 family protein [Lagierella massiliensis]|uniref:phosphatase PAP2 family protein n=1 Tax=Lagierella massiliensis TaxID=1689303 RepID=UPI0006D77161|nr:phosphatase PAP2 family protein [Lagierella massiliensis]
MKKRDKIIILFAFAWLISLIVSFKMNTNFFENYDYNILSFIRSNTHLTSFYKFITFFGNTTTYFYIFIPVGIWMIYKKKGKKFIYILASILIATLIMVAIKNTVRRIRPIDFFVIEQGGYSFPSGHSIVSAATYWTIYRINDLRNNPYKVFLVIFPLLIGFSRLALGVHWPTDVITGLLLGYSISSVVDYKYKKELL